MASVTDPQSAASFFGSATARNAGISYIVPSVSVAPVGVPSAGAEIHPMRAFVETSHGFNAFDKTPEFPESTHCGNGDS
jgi:hypothetical protein